MNQKDQKLYDKFAVIKSNLQKWKLEIEEYLSWTTTADLVDKTEQLDIDKRLADISAIEKRIRKIEVKKGWLKEVSSSSNDEEITDIKVKGRKVKIQQVGDPKKIKPEYKGANFDYQANAEKIRHYNNNLTDGGHYYGSAHKIEGMVFLYKQPTHEATYRVVCRFANAAQVNAWNDKVDNFLGNVNTVM